MKGFFKNKVVVSVIIIFLCIVITMSIVNKDGKNANFIEKSVSFVITPVQKLFVSAGRGISGFFEYFSNKKELISEIDELKKEIAKLEYENRDYLKLKSENDRLLKSLDIKENNKNLDLVSAKVIAKEQGNWFYVFSIDRGTDDGIEEKMAVLAYNGVVGYVSSVAKNSAVVVSIIDSNSSFGALITRTGDIAVVEGDALLMNDGLCKMTYVSSNTTLIEGDTVETLGMGEIYPKGMLIGRVKEVSPDVYGVSQTATIEPAVDFKKINEVFVVKNKRNE